MQSSRASTHALDAPSRLASAAWAAAGSSSRHKPIATYVDRGEPIANERGPGERALRRARRTSTVQLGRAERDERYRVWRDEVLLPSIAAGRAWRRGLACPLVGHSQSHVRSRSVGSLTEWSRAWALAEELRAHFGVGHLLRGPPFLANLSLERATHLNAKIQARLDRQKHPNP